LVAKYIKKYKTPYVMDPVMIATSGDRLMTDQSMNTLISELIPLADIITPNLHEAEAIAGMKITSEQNFKTALKIMRDDRASKNVVIERGHVVGDDRNWLY